MSNLVRDRIHNTRSNAGRRSYVLADGVTFYGGALVGVNAAGYLAKWADTAGHHFAGVLLEGGVGDTSANPPTEGRVDTSRVTLESVPVASLAQSDVGALVYCTTDNVDDLTLSAGTNVSAIGTVVRFVDPGIGDVQLFDSAKYLEVAGLGAITPLTDNSTGTGTDTIAAGVGVTTVTIPLTSLATGLSTSAIDLLTAYTPGYAFKILAFGFVTTVAGTGAGASQVFNLEIGTTNVTGGALTVTLASTDTIGEVTSATAVTAANVGTASDTISIEMAAGGTVFTAGAGYFTIRIQNMDTANAVASLSDKINEVINV
jgi:hypothetical protein